MSRRRRGLPDFLVIGAQRSGTTTLFYDLCRHPQVAGSPVKEVHFFDHHFSRGVGWYRSFFPPTAAQERARRRGGELLGGEATPNYLFHPAAPERAAETVPHVRLIAILRDPVDRAYSHYRKSVERRVERLSFEAALAAEERTMVFFEAPHRTEATLAAMAEAFGPDRRGAVCRELTKTHEEVRRAGLADLAAWAADGVRGEVTLVVEGASGASDVPTDPDSLAALVAEAEGQGSTRKDAILVVARRAGLPKRIVYDAVHKPR